MCILISLSSVINNIIAHNFQCSYYISYEHNVFFFIILSLQIIIISKSDKMSFVSCFFNILVYNSNIKKKIKLVFNFILIYFKKILEVQYY